MNHKHGQMSCECKLDCRKCNSDQKWNNDKRCCECKNQREHYVREKILNPFTCKCGNGKYLRSIINDSVVK